MDKQGSTARMRLQQAAVEMFRERGYDRTTAAEIAARAGVTERTFFRHFADKREVLFDGQAVLSEALTRSIADAPMGMRPLDMLFRAFRAVTGLLERNRPFAVPRQEVIAATPALQERELSKLDALADVLAHSLRARGVADRRALMAAKIGVAAFAQATLAWLERDTPSLSDRIDTAERDLQSLFED